MEPHTNDMENLEKAIECSSADVQSSGNQIATVVTNDRPQAELRADSDPNGSRIYVVGLGASAGGLESLERFFQTMPADSGMAFVVLQHLSPDFKSMMDELLARQTPMAIHQAENEMQVEPNCVYLIPPKKEMIVSGGRLLLTDKDPKQGLSLPIDHFFRSLAQDVGSRAVAVVLSGTGSDGSRGIRDVHGAGGLVLAESDDTAKFDGMPRSAQETGVVDYVLAPEDMPAVLLEHINRTGNHSATLADAEVGVHGAMQTLLRLLKKEYGIDFSHYKPGTVVRRIERRLQMCHSASLEEYVEGLAFDHEELNSLYRDLLIGVTKFFRDREAFERLETEVLPGLLSNIGDGQELRVWVAGCATGEEAYSLAILIHEQLELRRRQVQVKIFATDVHRASLEFASCGVYSAESLSEVSPQRLQRCFLRQENGYHITSDLRQMIVFAPHNIIKDAPFTRLDLITCRNLLIYLQPPAQKKALSLFHFGLKTGGVLFLGPSESPGDLGEEFETLDTHWKIYRKLRDVRLPSDLRLPLVTGAPLVYPVTTTASRHTPGNPDLLGVYDRLLAEHMPPSLLLNERRELVHSFGGASRFLRIRDGRQSANLLDYLDGELKIAVAGALQRVAKENGPVVCNGVLVEQPTGPQRLKLTVSPVQGRHSNLNYTLVSLAPLESPPVVATGNTRTEFEIDNLSRERLESLEAELNYTRESLQATVEELETSNEELQAANEELLASNEELQSTNEELHSVNEELYTVNAEYQRKISELTELNNDMDNLLASTEIGTIFLDHDLRIRKVTPRIGQWFHLLPHDLGRRIDNFTHTLDYPSLFEDVQHTMETGQVVEREIRDRQGTWLLLRILPYRSQAKVGGAVLTLVDISTLKKAQTDLQETQELLQQVLDNSSALIYVKDLDGRYLLVNRNCKRMLCVPPEQVRGKTDHDFLPAELADMLRAHDQQVIESGSTGEFEETLPCGDELRTWLSVKFPLRDAQDHVYAVGGVCTDITDRKRAEQAAQQAVELRDRFLAMLSHELRNPLNAVVNAIHVMSSTTLDAATLEAARDVIVRQSQQMSRLLDDLLDVSRITQNKIELRMQVLNLADVLEEVIGIFRPTTEKRRLEFRAEVQDVPLYIEGDSARLQQIVVNLLNNAVKYTPEGGEIQLAARRDGDQALLSVRDSGVGIPPDMLPRVFDLFVQSDESLDRADGGLGVGLSLVKSIVEMHGGTVAAHSEGLGHGSEFVVRLPLTQQNAPQCAAESPNMEERFHILLVEDNPDSRTMLAMLLRLQGHEVSTAPDGIAGLEVLRQQAFDLALVDVGLPGLDGYQVAQAAREGGLRDMLLVALTGFGQSADQARALAAGFDLHVVKPFKPEDLARVFAEAARRKALS